MIIRYLDPWGHGQSTWERFTMDFGSCSEELYCRGLTNYLYYFGGRVQWAPKPYSGY